MDGTPGIVFLLPEGYNGPERGASLPRKEDAL